MLGESVSDRENAVAQVFAFLTAGVIFVAAVGAVLYATVDLGTNVPAADAASQGREAQSIADLLIGSRGDWTGGADDLGRLGLRGPDGGIDPDRLALLKGADPASSANGLADYADALQSLGLDPDDGTQVHIRIHPVGLNTTLKQLDLSTLRLGYVGDWTRLPAVTVDLDVDVQVMADRAVAAIDVEAALATLAERDLLQDLGVDFTNRPHIGVGEPDVQVDLGLVKVPVTDLVPLDLLAGDVYPDAKIYLDSVLPGRISEYDVLFVGTGVDQQTLTSSVTKHAIREWVLAGGTLIVMGSDNQNVQWLQPLFDVGVSTVNEGLSAPDLSHPLLLEPTQLAWSEYDHHDLGWGIKDKEEDKFQQILMAGDDTTLTVSKDGSFGDGRIFLSTFRPFEIALSQGQTEAQAFIHNMLLYTERNDLYLDYGPEIPVGTDVSVGTRHTFVTDPTLGQVAMQVQVHVWRI